MRQKTTSEQLTQIYSHLENKHGRVLPSDENLEKFVLGCMMLDEFHSNIAIEILGFAEGEEIPFYNFTNKIIFEILSKIIQTKENANLLAVSKYIISHGLEIKQSDIAELMNLPISTSNLAQSCRKLQDLHNRRKLILQSELIAQKGYEEKELLANILDESESGLIQIRNDRKTNDPKRLDKIDFANEKQFEVGYKTGIPGIDNLLHKGAGAQVGDYIIIAARPSVGKTTLAINFAANEAMQANGSLFISLEMTNEQVVGKFFENISGCPVWKLNPKYDRLSLSQTEHDGKEKFEKNKSLFEFYTDDSTYHSPLSIRAQVSRWKRKHNIKAVFVDYLQLISPSLHYQNAREREVAEISKSLKAMAKEFQLPFFVLSQLNRTSLARTDKKPSLGDLRESGSLEQDADCVIFLHDPLMSMAGNENPVRTMEIIVAKNRLGACKTISVEFFTEYSTFAEITEAEYLSRTVIKAEEAGEKKIKSAFP